MQIVFSLIILQNRKMCANLNLGGKSHQVNLKYNLALKFSVTNKAGLFFFLSATQWIMKNPVPTSGAH